MKVLYKHINTLDIITSSMINELPNVGDTVTLFKTDYLVREVDEKDPANLDDTEIIVERKY